MDDLFLCASPMAEGSAKRLQLQIGPNAVQEHLCG